MGFAAKARQFEARNATRAERHASKENIINTRIQQQNLLNKVYGTIDSITMEYSEQGLDADQTAAKLEELGLINLLAAITALDVSADSEPNKVALITEIDSLYGKIAARPQQETAIAIQSKDAKPNVDEARADCAQWLEEQIALVAKYNGLYLHYQQVWMSIVDRYVHKDSVKDKAIQTAEADTEITENLLPSPSPEAEPPSDLLSNLSVAGSVQDPDSIDQPSTPITFLRSAHTQTTPIPEAVISFEVIESAQHAEPEEAEAAPTASAEKPELKLA